MKICYPLVVDAKVGNERMLTIEQIYHIKYLKNYKGLPLREISEVTGHAFEIVKKYVKKEDFNFKIPERRTRKVVYSK